MSFLFLFIVLFTVALNSPSVLSADVRAETEMAGGGDASRMRENRRLTAGVCEPGGRRNQATLFRFPFWFTALFLSLFSLSFFFFLFFSSLTRSFRSKILRSFFFLFCPIFRACTFVFENFFNNEIEFYSGKIIYHIRRFFEYGIF